MRVVVTGGAGFIGSHIVDALVARGDEVLVIDDLSTGSHENVSSEVAFEQIDIRDATAVQDVFERFKPQGVIHQAALVSVGVSVKEPERAHEINVEGTKNLLEAAGRAGVRVFVFASTAGVYGEPEMLPTPVDAPLAPYNPYAESKRVAEQLVQTYAEENGIHWTVLRYANVYGERQNASGEGGVIAIFCRSVAEGDSPTVFGDGTQTRDFIYVQDIVRANLMALDEIGPAGVYNVGTGSEQSLLDLIQVLEETSGVVLKPHMDAPRSADVQRSVLDPTETTEELGWKAQTPFKEGIASTYQWFAKQK
ncbi:MAG: NAD-dependent epimerase/dehydratase family protein [Candidatus Doudnabacteria bacterium]|nr:NAD-dependent epimerase/dehydratase family protein [Candidatus Doudnabacteria bacterium]